MKNYLLLCLCLVSGCTSLLPQNPNLARTPIPLKDAIIQQAQPPDATLNFPTRLINEEKFHKEYECQVVANGKSTLAFNYIQSTRPGKKPLIIIFNILKDPDMTVSHLLSDYITYFNYDCLIIRQKFFMSEDYVRPVIDNGSNILSYDEYNIALAQNVIRIIKHWMPQQKQLTGEIGFVGVSMGGFHAIGAAALYPEAKITIAMMCGADNADVIKASEENIVKYNREQLLISYRKKHGAMGEDLLYRDINSRKYNIVDMARSIETSKIRLVITTNDTSVPTFTQWRLYRLHGGPESLIVPSGHITLVFYILTVRSQLIDWLNETFNR